VNKLLHVPPLNNNLTQMNITELLFMSNIQKGYAGILFLTLA